MKLLIINSVCGIRSTGRITTDIALEYEKKGYEVKIAYGREKVPEQYKRFAVRIGNNFNVRLNALSCRLFDNDGFAAKTQTKKFIKWANEFDPDELWLHNLHGYYINVELLFNWIKSRPKMKVKWTLHDCWAFTGHCSHFSFVECDKWIYGCNNCIQKRQYPSSFLKDRSCINYKKKKNAFCNVNNLSIIVVSHWLESIVKKSFLKNYEINVVYNKVDKSIFIHKPGVFKTSHKIENKKMVLGVSNVWDERKGLNDFFALSKMLGPNYIIVLVGLNKKQINELPKNILGIERTNNIQQLIEIYSEADVFVNPSKEETFGLTTVEAKLCGTMPIVYKNTACEEVVNIYGGYAVDRNLNSMLKKIIEVCEDNTYENRNNYLS